MIVRRVPLVLLSILLAARAGATAQAPDILKLGGKTYSIHSNPLAPFLAANPGRLPESEVVNTGLWRGYIATWSVREKKLFLEDVRILTKAYVDPDAPESKQFRSVVKDLFGDSRRRAATWFTGHLIVPTGNMVQYVHMGYASTYSSYIVLTVNKGVIEKRRDLTGDDFLTFRRAQFEAYKKTPEYAKAFAEARKGDESTTDEQTEEFLFQVASEEYLARIFER